MRYDLIHNGLRGSVMMSFLVRRTRLNFSYRSSRSFIGSPRSLAHLRIIVPLLWRPSMVIIPLWVACWGETFHKLLLLKVVESFLSVDADIGSPGSLLFLSNCTPRILISITSLPRAYCSRGWYVTLAIRLIIGRDIAVTRSSPESCASLFAIVSDQTVELKWLVLNIPFITCEISFG